MVEKKKLENDNNKITKNANFDIFMSSIFFPNQIRTTLEQIVAAA